MSKKKEVHSHSLMSSSCVKTTLPMMLTHGFRMSKHCRILSKIFTIKSILFLISKSNHANISIDIYASEYNMGHKYRGLAIIFNHMTFDKLDKRLGTELDTQKLSESLTNLNFTVQIYQDSSCDEIKAIIEDTSKNVDHIHHDCILIAVMSHGDHGSICAKDKAYPLDTLWSSFTPDKCPSLAGKPRIFIIQACQGNKRDEGYKMGRFQTDGPSTKYYKIPKYADFLIAHSTMPGYISWRQPKSGSWFIQTLCKELNENGKRIDIERLLRNVRQKVAIDYESNTNEPDSSGQKQIPTTTSTLTRMLTFTEK